MVLGLFFASQLTGNNYKLCSEQLCSNKVNRVVTSSEAAIILAFLRICESSVREF